MPTLPHAKPAKKKARSPLGWYVAGLLAGELDCMTTMREAAGELGERIVQAFTHTRWNELVGAVRLYAEPQHDANELCVRIACVHALKALERTSPENRRACSSALFRGHTHRVDDDGVRQYVPSNSGNNWAAGGLSSRLKRSPRTLDRHCQVLELAGIADVWQPPAADLPKSMRGADYAYAVYEWRSALPRPVVELLIAWWGSAEQRQQAVQRAKRAERAAPAGQQGGPAIRTTPGSAAAAARFLALVEPPDS